MTVSAKENEQLNNYHQELSEELLAILHYWKTVVTNSNNDFYGEVDDDNKPDPLAPKGIVLFSRILWTFSEAGLFLSDKDCLQKATAAFHFIEDPAFGSYMRR